jgi:membrane protein DedA with SNARE-associated domain
MLENIEVYLELLISIPFYWLVLIALAATFIENLLPPSPSDMILVAVAVITGITKQSIIPIIIAGTIGSTLGFCLVFSLGRKFNRKIIETNRIKFVSKEAVEKVDILFKRWGFKLVVANRFMSGTRAIVSFFAGMAGLPFTKTTVLSGISSFLWYGILSSSGYYFGSDWRELIGYLRIYDKIAIAIVVLLTIAGIFFWFKKPASENPKIKATSENPKIKACD